MSGAHRTGGGGRKAGTVAAQGAADVEPARASEPTDRRVDGASRADAERPGPPAATEAATGLRLPDRRYFRIGEVAELMGVKPHVLRYWETEFREIRPRKSRQGQRLYTRRDVEVVAAVRRLLYAERFTIAGAREKLRAILDEGRLDLFVAPKVSVEALDTARLELLREGLRGLLDLVDRRADDLASTRD